MSASLDERLAGPIFGLRQAEKEQALLPLLLDLTQHHRTHCAPYRQITDLAFAHAASAQNLAAVPYLPISLFKHRRLHSVGDEEIRVTIASSGTSGRRSRIGLDVDTAKLSARALAAILNSVLPNRRLPMLIIDHENAISGKDDTSARASAILGLMPFGRDHCFALDEKLQADTNKIAAFLDEYGNQDVLIFGFTYLIWQCFIPACETRGYDLSHATLLHSGGWKKLTEIAVDNAGFKSRLHRATQIDRVMNFYGMAETPGVIFLENIDGLLYPPGFADVIIRDPVSFKPLPQGQAGLIQILSALPRSYPGHSLLTEDIGIIESVDSGIGGRFGQGLRVLGRAPKAELRGCSDIVAEAA